MKVIIRSILLFSSLALLLVAYQNCAGSADFGSLRKESNPEAFSFPLKMEADYIGTMSCAGVPQSEIANNTGYYTIKLMSDSIYSQGGIGLDEDFLGYVRNEEQKRPATFHLPTEIEIALQASDKLEYAAPQMSLLNDTNRSSSVLEQSGVYFSKVYSSLQLDRQDMLDRLKLKSDTSSVSGYDFDMRFDWRKYDRTTMEEIMESLSGGGGLDTPSILGLNYQSEKGNFGQFVRSATEFGDETVGGVYGRTFRLNHSQNRLYGIIERESELRGGNYDDVQGKSWSCKQLKIVRPTDKDVQDSQCLNMAAGDSWRPIGQEADPVNVPLHRAMLGLLGDKWLTNKARDCIIHISKELGDPDFACYGTTNLAVPVSYHAFVSNEQTVINAQYASVCWANY